MTHRDPKYVCCQPSLPQPEKYYSKLESVLNKRKNSGFWKYNKKQKKVFVLNQNTKSSAQTLFPHTSFNIDLAQKVYFGVGKGVVTVTRNMYVNTLATLETFQPSIWAACFPR